MARRGFLYWLFSKNKLPYYVDAAGHVQEADGNYLKPDQQPAHLEYAPDGWRDALVHWARNLKYFGLVRDFSVPVKFVNDGAIILRDRMWSEGVEAVCHLGIGKLDRQNLPYNYPAWWRSELNFSKYIQTKTGVEIEALEGGLAKLIKALENTVYTIQIDKHPEHIEIDHDGMDMSMSAHYIHAGMEDVGALGPHGGSKYIMPVSFINQEGRPRGIAYLTSTLEVLAAGPTTDLSQNQNYFFYTDRTQEIRLHGSIKANFGGTAQSFTFRIQDNYNTVHFDANPGLASAYSGEREFPFDLTLNLSEDTKLFMYAVDALGNTIDFIETKIDIEFVYRPPASIVKALRLKTVLEELVKQMSNGEYTCKSNLLDSLTDYCLTSGDALRGLENSVLKTSLSEFFRFLFARFSVGLAVHNDQLVIEKLEDFFKSDTVVNVGQVSEVNISVADDMMGNLIKAGYEKQEYSDVNGKYETNQGQQWTTPVTRVIREIDLVSPYRADPFGIEIMRINAEGKTTSDTEGDNDVFCLNISKTDIGEPGELEADISSEHEYTGPSSLVFDTVNPGPGFTPNATKDQFTFTGVSQIIHIYTNFTVTGSGINPTISIMINGVAVASAVFPLGSNTTLTADIPIATGDILSIQISGMSFNVEVNVGEMEFSYISAGRYELNRPAYSSVTGIPHPDSAYNLEMTPKKGILANGRYLKSLLDLLDTLLLKCQSADKNRDLVTVLDGVTVDEDEDIQIGSLGDPLWRPYYVTFKTKVPINLLELLKANPWGRVKFTYNDHDFYGFLMDGSIKPGTSDAQTWKLLCAPETNLKLFAA